MEALKLKSLGIYFIYNENIRYDYASMYRFNKTEPTIYSSYMYTGYYEGFGIPGLSVVCCI